MTGVVWVLQVGVKGEQLVRCQRAFIDDDIGGQGAIKRCRCASASSPRKRWVDILRINTECVRRPGRPIVTFCNKQLFKVRHCGARSLADIRYVRRWAALANQSALGRQLRFLRR